MDKAYLINRLNIIQDQISRPRWLRILLKSTYHLNWAFTKLGLSSKEKSRRTFFNTILKFPFPASKDIFIWSAKSHDSEIRLAKFIIHTLGPGDQMVDIGTHVGYFTQLAAKIVGERGKVYAFEASPNSYRYLKLNTEAMPQVKSYNKAVTEQKGVKTFNEYDTEYSEFNSLSSGEKLEGLKVRTIDVDTISLDNIKLSGPVKLIKIDVEGSENLVIRGMQNLLNNYPFPIIVMEYLKDLGKNEAHKKASQYLFEFGYEAYKIDSNGNPYKLDKLDNYIANLPFESDNIIFKKSHSS